MRPSNNFIYHRLIINLKDVFIINNDRATEFRVEKSYFFFLFDYTHWREKLSRKIILYLSILILCSVQLTCITVGYKIYKGFPNKFAKTKFLEPILEVQCKLISNGGLLAFHFDHRLPTHSSSVYWTPPLRQMSRVWLLSYLTKILWRCRGSLWHTGKSPSMTLAGVVSDLRHHVRGGGTRAPRLPLPLQAVPGLQVFVVH